MIIAVTQQAVISLREEQQHREVTAGRVTGLSPLSALPDQPCVCLGLQVMILITGAHKAFALYKAIEDGVNHMWTVSAFQQHPNTVFVCDEDATLELKVKTVKYFKGECLGQARQLFCYIFRSHC